MTIMITSNQREVWNTWYILIIFSAISVCCHFCKCLSLFAIIGKINLFFSKYAYFVQIQQLFFLNSWNILSFFVFFFVKTPKDSLNNKNNLDSFSNLSLEAKQNKLQHQLPNGHATLIGGCNTLNASNANNKIPPRPPTRSQTTTVSIAGPSSCILEEQPTPLCGSQLNNLTNHLSNESPNVKFVLTQKNVHHKQQQPHETQPIPKAAMSEMRV